MRIPEPKNTPNDKDPREAGLPWSYHPECMDGVPWDVELHLTGKQLFHVVTNTYHYPTRDAARADMKQALAKLGITTDD